MNDKRSLGLYEKFRVERTDGTSAAGQKHDGCEYFVLDLSHDPFAALAIQRYADVCRVEYPQLAADLDLKVAAATLPGRAQASPNVNVDVFRREVKDKLGVARSLHSSSPLQQTIVLRQCEDFLVDLFVNALASADAAVQEPNPWQPIETAPKDGTVILIKVPSISVNEYCVREAQWERLLGQHRWCRRGAWFVASHWMPLPAAAPLPATEPTQS